MSYVDLDDYECPCDNKAGTGELNIKAGIYTCGRCGKTLDEAEEDDPEDLVEGIQEWNEKKNEEKSE